MRKPQQLIIPDTAEIVALGRQAGLDAVGVATADVFESTKVDLEERKAVGLHGGMNFTYRRPERSTDPKMTLPSAEALVVGALGYRRPNDDNDFVAPGLVARYSWQDYYKLLRDSLREIVVYLKDLGWKAVLVADENALVDREAAFRAGLGWYGKNANLLLPGQGSWFVLGTVITNAPIKPSETPEHAGCGTCTRCIDYCPTQAIVAPGVVDARRCLAWLVQAPGMFPIEHRVALKNRIYGCDDCQEVCPPNLTAQRRGTREGEVFPPETLERAVDLLSILTASDDDLLDEWGRWYIPGREARYLRRNALIGLGNTADPSHPEVVAALSQALIDDDPVIQGHAVWAAKRLGRNDLVVSLVTTDDEDVRSEIQANVPIREDLN